MRKMRHVFLTVGVFFSLASFSQTVTPATLNATGGTNFFTFYRFEWSFGESMAIETMSSSNLIVTNGVLQPGTHDPAKIDNTGDWGKDEIKILPNPTQNILEIDFFSKQQGKLTLSLYDASGRFLASRQFDYFGTGRIEKWNLDRYQSGTYLLNIQLDPTGNSVAKKGSYKVIKIK
jgi:Secretion system C-terminal sorting domain